MPNFARSRGRSRRLHPRTTTSTGLTRTLLVVPALLAALVAPLLPAGTALAALPAPPAPTKPLPESPRAAAALSDPAPTPSPTTDPSPTPDPTPEPTPTAPEPTDGPCRTLSLTPLGVPGDASGAVAVAERGTACFTVTVERAGTHRMLVENQHTYPTLYSGETPVACGSYSYRDTWCELASGTYTLRLANTASVRVEARVSLVPLMSGPGCQAVPGTGYDDAPATGAGAGPTGVVCRSFPGAPGDRVTVTGVPDSGLAGPGWITDDTGTRVCPVREADGGDGCVLPESAGGYRYLGVVDAEGDGSASSYTLLVRRLSDPVGCAPVAVTAYGSAPAAAAPATGCRTFTPAATGRYDVHAITPGDQPVGIEVYAQDGSTVCATGENCALTGGVPYTLVTDAAVRVLDRASTAGCTSDVALAVAHRGTFAARGAVDCLLLPVPQGAHLAVLSDGAATLTVVDAEGRPFCGSGLAEGTCALGGTAPYRVLVAQRYADAASDSYGLVVHRTDAPSACRTFLPGDFTPDPARMRVRTGDGVFADCLTIPADGHAPRELAQIQRVAGTAHASVVVLDAAGRKICSIGTYNSPWTTCALTPGLAHTVLLQGSDAQAEFELTRRDLTASARGCVTTPAVAVGSPSTGGAPAPPGGFRCHQVTTADARDTLHLNARDALATTRLGVYGADGVGLCGYFTKGCAVTGSTRYQVLVVVREDEQAAATYRLDALRIGTAAGPAPECVRIPNASYGFTAPAATLSEQKSAVCAVLPTATSDSFDLRFTPAGSSAQLPTPWLYHSSPATNGCTEIFGSADVSYTCSLPFDATRREAVPSTLVIGLPEKPAETSTALRAEFTCAKTLCGPEAWSASDVGPATVGRGRVTMSVTGTALHEGDKLFLVSADGGFRTLSAPFSVAADRRSATVEVDLTGAALGPLDVTVVPRWGSSRPGATVTVVAPLRNTAAASVSGAAVVGGKVTAGTGSWSLPVDSFAYEWRADGVAIAGATGAAYTVPAALQGKALSVSVVARKAGHPTLTSVSAAVTVQGVTPVATKAPSLSGTARVRRTLVVNRGTWTEEPTSYTYQWYADGRAISGATRSAFTLTQARSGQRITVEVAAHRAGRPTGYAWTAATAPVTSLTAR
ncbi:hypothetical protein AB1388_00880 [Streptomyces hydrogenans]